MSDQEQPNEKLLNLVSQSEYRISEDPNKITLKEEDCKELFQLWNEQAKSMTLDKLPDFINGLMNNYNHDYGTICIAIATCMYATFSATNKSEQGGVTGFQAGNIQWELIKRLGIWDDPIGIRLTPWSGLLHPHGLMELVAIPEAVAKKLQSKSTELLLSNNDPNFDKQMIAYWKNLSQGIYPKPFNVVKK